MGSMSEEHAELLSQARQGDTRAIAELFNAHRERLRRLIHIRLDPRLAGRIDASDVLQETYVDIHKRIHEYTGGDLPFFLWLRLKVQHRLVDLHRFHLGAKKRSATKEISLRHGMMPMASSASLASKLLGKMTSASNAAIRDETRLRVQDALNQMDEIDREVLVLRHFEDLTNAEVSQVLSINASAASNRYVRALRRLKAALTDQTISIDGE